METDFLDQAATCVREATDRVVKNISEQAANINTNNPSGRCLCCGDDTGTDKRWCDVECRDEWVRRYE